MRRASTSIRNLNKYDLEHACTDHPRMSRQKWTEVYRDAFARYYTDEHVEKIMRRAIAGGLQSSKLVTLLTIFSSCVRIEGVHPLQFGLVRRKSRTQRRHGMPLVHPLIFYPWRAYDFSKAATQWGLTFWRYHRMRKGIKKDPAAKSYSDEALRLPPDADEADKIVELFADKIPHTHGAPVRAASGVSAAR
jgi:hypothetical protein